MKIYVDTTGDEKNQAQVALLRQAGFEVCMFEEKVAPVRVADPDAWKSLLVIR